MKKIIFAIVAALPLMFASCGNDDEDNSMSLDKGAVSLNYGQTTTLKASEKNVTWYSDNDFVATVDDKGEVTAQHVGETKIYASKDGERVACTVTVNATNNNFKLPILTWGSTYAYVLNAGKSISPNLVVDPDITVENEEIFFYTDDGSEYGVLPWYDYIFNNGELDSSILTISMADDSSKDFEGFLDQRYEYYRKGTDEGRTVFFYRNSTTSETADIFVEYGMDPESGVYALFAKTVTTNTKGGIVRPESANRALESVKARLAK